MGLAKAVTFTGGLGCLSLCRFSEPPQIAIQKMARGLKFWIKEVEGLCYISYVAKTKALTSCMVII